MGTGDHTGAVVVAQQHSTLPSKRKALSSIPGTPQKSHTESNKYIELNAN